MPCLCLSLFLSLSLILQHNQTDSVNMAHQRFTLTRGTPDEMDEMARLQWECFPPFARQKFMGCQTEADLPRLAERARDDMRANVHDIWIMVRDTQAGGRLAAASNWRIYLNEAAARTCDDKLPPGLAEGGDAEAREKAVKMMDEMNAGRKKANPHGFLRTFAFPSFPCP